MDRALKQKKREKKIVISNAQYQRGWKYSQLTSVFTNFFSAGIKWSDIEIEKAYLVLYGTTGSKRLLIVFTASYLCISRWLSSHCAYFNQLLITDLFLRRLSSKACQQKENEDDGELVKELGLAFSKNTTDSVIIINNYYLFYML